MRNILEFSKKKRNICERALSGVTCTKFQVDILKKAEFCRFEGRKQPFFTLFPAISAFFRFSNFFRFRPFKKCSRVIFRVLDEKLTKNMHHAAQTQNFQFDLSLTS